MRELMIGTSAHPDADGELLKEAGIGWVRTSFPFPFRERVGGELTKEYAAARERAEQMHGNGFRLMGVTPLPGIATRERDEEGNLQFRRWNRRVPDWCGELGSEQLRRTYRRTCRWLAEYLGDLVPAWQVANELDIYPFAGGMNPKQACDLLHAGATGLKEADSSLLVGLNLTAGWGRTLYFVGYFHGKSAGPLDYVGLDGYYGTWQEGGPESWENRIETISAWTGAPVLVNEWGYSSAGGVMNEEEKRSGASVCDLHKWKHTWGSGHNREGQAEFVREAFEVFRRRRESILGLFFYRWEDQQECWQCGAPDCPAETAWGLVDREGRPKPAYHSFKEGTERLLA